MKIEKEIGRDGDPPEVHDSSIFLMLGAASLLQLLQHH